MIRINDEYFVEVDSLNYTLKRKATGVKKDGTPIVTDKIVGYYNDLRNAIFGACEDCKRTEFSKNNYSLNEALTRIQEINDSFTEILKQAIRDMEV